MIELLLANGADVNQANNGGLVPVMVAARSEAGYKGSNEVALVKLLIDHGAKVNSVDNDGHTVLMYVARYACIAAQDKSLVLIDLLLDHGMEIDLQDVRGWTALMHIVESAVYSNYGWEIVKTEKKYFPMGGEIIKLLLTRGANPDLTNNDGKTALDIAKSLDYKEGIYILEDYLKERDKWREAVEYANFINELLNEPFDNLGDFLDRNAQRTKEFVGRVIKSDFPAKVKEQAGRLLDVINSGTQSINPRYVTDLANNVIQYGGIPYLLCEMTFAGVGALLFNVPGAYAGFEPSVSLCLL